ncbi:hypothetical protein KR018_007206 [Drosophila ironensis]|nr:hypothetical protein KR018_007206 [Drosophila ironensis]
MTLERKILFDGKDIPWMLWLPPFTNPNAFEGPQVIAFTFVANWYGARLGRWVKLYDRLAEEFAGRILFALRDISTIGDFNSNLKGRDFGSYEKGVPPLIFGRDEEQRVYEMHKLFNYKNMKDFCDQLVQDKLFQAVVLGATAEQDSEPRNYFEIQEQGSGEMFTVMYQPDCYFWPIQQRMLRKLVRYLTEEDLPVVIVDSTKSFLGVVFHRWLNAITCHGSSIYSTPCGDGWDMDVHVRLEGTRDYLRYIARKKHQELKHFNAQGEARGAVEALDYIRYLF